MLPSLSSLSSLPPLSSPFPHSFKPRPSSKTQNPITHLTTPKTQIPARDLPIGFGKYKGKKLGTLPSSYLKWVSQNLRARDPEHWAILADQVLQDPVYQDRIEWEFAEKILNGDVLRASHSSSSGLGSESAVSELLELSQRFGWDNENDAGWKKIDFALLGTSSGGRIPRIGDEKERREKGREEVGDSDGVEEFGVSERRRDRRRRVKLKRDVEMHDKKLEIVKKERRDKLEHQVEGVGNDDGDSDQMVEIYNPFPGREALLKKVLNRRRAL